MKTRLTNYFPILLLVLIIFLTINSAPVISKFLATHFGTGVYNIVYFITAFVFIIALKIIYTSKEKIITRIISLFILTGIFILALVNIKYSIEKIHYIEYGLLTFLGFNTLTKDFRTISAVLLSIMLSYFTGLADEFLQHLTFSRVAEFADVALNVKAGLFGALFALILKKPSKLIFLQGFKDAIYLLSGSLLSVIAAFLFIEHVHGFGFYIKDPFCGSFYSSFDSTSLLAINDSLSKGCHINPGTFKIYENEAIRHKTQRDFYLVNKFPVSKNDYYIEYGKTWRENRILEKYFKYFIDVNSSRWDSATYSFVSQRQWEDTSWNSRVKETLIISYSRSTIRTFFIGLFLVLTTFLIFVIRADRKTIQCKKIKVL